MRRRPPQERQLSWFCGARQHCSLDWRNRTACPPLRDTIDRKERREEAGMRKARKEVVRREVAKREWTWTSAGPVHAFLACQGRDGSGRTLSDVLHFDDARLEREHDYIQWLFPLREPSQAVPGSPVLGEAEAEAIRRDTLAQSGLLLARLRMLRFYEATGGWLRIFDHNHLRITRILTALRDLAGLEAAQDFYDGILLFHDMAGAPVNSVTLEYWRRAMA